MRLGTYVIHVLHAASGLNVSVLCGCMIVWMWLYVAVAVAASDDADADDDIMFKHHMNQSWHVDRM